MLRITEDRSNRVDRLAEHLGARPYMARLVRAKRLGYFETPSANVQAADFFDGYPAALILHLASYSA